MPKIIENVRGMLIEEAQNQIDKLNVIEENENKPEKD